jgi:hypothetical protein
VKRLLITGTRYGWDEEVLRGVLARTYTEMIDEPDEPVLLVHGAAPGVDTQVARIWEEMGQPTEAHPADWSIGKKAGPLRNLEMVALGADVCLAFVAPDSRGTVHCAGAAEEAGIPVQRFYE